MISAERTVLVSRRAFTIGGCHDDAYRRRLPGQLAFLGRHLASR
ncbi:hypothetical protein [Spirillospora albida]|nr:hypothetical protein [Spirillospora albida]